jgi:hypothetical protein
MSAQASPRDRIPAFPWVMAARVLSKSGGELAIGRAGHHRHVAGGEHAEQPTELGAVGLRPLATSRNTFLQPTRVSWCACSPTL